VICGLGYRVAHFLHRRNRNETHNNSFDECTLLTTLPEVDLHPHGVTGDFEERVPLVVPCITYTISARLSELLPVTINRLEQYAPE